MSADARRAALRAELRKEIDQSSRLLVHTTSSSFKRNEQAARVVVARDPGQLREGDAPASSDAAAGSTPGRRGDSPRRSESFYRNFQGSNALACIRGSGGTQNMPASPARRGRSPVRRGSPAPEGASDQPQQASTADGVNMSRAGPVARTVFDHHKGIVVPGERGASPSSNDVRLYTRKPLKDGSRSLPIRRQFPDRSRSPATMSSNTSEAGGDAGGTGTPSRRSDSPSKGRRRIDPQTNLSGCAAQVSREQPVRVTGRHHAPEAGSRGTSPGRAPYFEPLLESPKPNVVGSGLLGFGPTGKAGGRKPEDHPRLLDDDTGRSAPEQVARGVRMVDGKSNAREDPLNADPTCTPREEPFKPSVVVMHGPPAFVPPPMPQRTQSPRRLLSGPDSDIFNTGPAAPGPAPPVVRAGRGMGAYSPSRQSERPF